MAKNVKISDSVIRRLPRYYRQLGDLLKEDIRKISSKELAEKMSLTASQIRQDFNNFGEFGQQGYGYNVELLRQEIARILHLHQRKSTILVGAGNLGKTIATHVDFSSLGFYLSAIFDSNPALAGTFVGQTQIRHSDELEQFCADNAPEIAVLCIPRDSAIAVAQQLASLGIKGFWNFSLYDLHVAYPGVCVENVHLADSLVALGFRVHLEDKQE